jgi:hypothetical protein
MSVLLLQVWITPIPYQFQGKTFDESAYHGAHCSCHSNRPASACLPRFLLLHHLS